MKNIKSFEKNQRVVTFLNRREVDFLDKMGKDALFSTGLKLSRAKLIAWLVDFIKELNLNGEGIKSIRDFEDRIKQNLEPRQGPVPASHACLSNRQEESIKGGLR